MTAPKRDEFEELRTEMAELRALLKLSIKRQKPRKRDLVPDAPPEASARRREIRAIVLGKIGGRKR